MKALRFDGRLSLVNDAPNPRRADEALIKVLAAGICNTDLEIVKGYAGFTGTLGHEFVGRVVESPDTTLIGKRVAGEINAGCGLCDSCLGGDSRHCSTRTVLGIKGRDGAFAEYLSLPSRNLHEVPDSVSDDEAVFIEPLAAALAVCERVVITRESKVAVLGDGKLGQLIARALARKGCWITMFGKHAAKLELVRGIAAATVLLEDSFLEEPPRDVSLLVNEEPFDVAIEASGSEAGLALALGLVKPRGVVVLKTTHHAVTRLDTSTVVVNEISIVGSRCGRFGPAIDLLAAGGFDLTPLISARFSLDDGLKAFKEAARAGSLKVLLRMS